MLNMKRIASTHIPDLQVTGLGCGFGRGTRLLTADGPMPVEEIEPGEAVLDVQGRPHFVLWQGGCEMRPVPGWAGDPRHPVVIAANAFGPGKPRRDLYVSQQHRVMVETAGHWAAVPARALAPHIAQIDLSGRPISVHAVVTRSPCNLMAENLPCESYLPGSAGWGGMAALSALLPSHVSPLENVAVAQP